jgi:hypothetical protein
MKRHYYILFALLFLGSGRAYSQNDSIYARYAAADTLNENSGLFDSNDLLTIALRFDITQYRKSRSDVDYLDAILTYYNSGKDTVNKEIKVRSRGIFRRDYCDFPPLMLNFKMKDSTEGEFSRINKLKMVTQCKAGNEEILLKEYLIYKLYNVITDIASE